MSSKLKYQIPSIIFSAFIVFMLIFSVPANAIEISVVTSKTQAGHNELVDFAVTIDMQSFEKVPIQNISATVKDNSNNIVSVCYFDVDGNKLSDCDLAFESITKIKDSSSYGYDNLNANYNSNLINFGYGYGYGYGGAVPNNPIFKYNISWRTPDVLVAEVTYNLFVEVNAKNNAIVSKFENNDVKSINVSMEKPVGLTTKNIYNFNELDVKTINASVSYDPNNYDLVKYEVYSNSVLIGSFTNNFFELTLSPGNYNLDLIVENQYGARSVAYPFLVTVSSERPIAILSQNSYDIFLGESVLLDASSSYDPNNFNLTEYRVYLDSDLVFSSDESVFEFKPESEGQINYSFSVLNENNVESEKIVFDVDVVTDFKSSNFEFDVNEFVDNSQINFVVKPLTDYDKKQVKLKPEIECLGINFKYSKEFMDTSLILQKDKEYSLSIDVDDFKYRFPYDNICKFKLYLIDENGAQIVLEDTVRFTDDISTVEEPVIVLNHGVDISGHLATVFSKEFNRGYNTIKFVMKNDGPITIGADVQVTISEVDYNYYQSLKIAGGSQANVMFPIYIDDNIKPGKYPVRISYRLNEEDLKIKYGYLIIN